MKRMQELEDRVEDLESTILTVKLEVSNLKEKKTRFKVPEYTHVLTYFKDRADKYGIEIPSRLAMKFFNHYESNNWMIGKVKMKKWQASANNWLSDNGTKQLMPGNFLG